MTTYITNINSGKLKEVLAKLKRGGYPDHFPFISRKAGTH